MSDNHSNTDTITENSLLDKDSWELHRALSELVRVYQFRDRNRICYYDISVTQCYALSALILNGAMSLNELAAKLYLDKSTASRVVDSLVQKNYVNRVVDARDGRARILEVTTRGTELHSRIERDLVNEMKQLLTDFNPDVRKATIRLFARLVDTVKNRFSKKSPDCISIPKEKGEFILKKGE